jgi:hypothetical protein
LFVVKRIRPDQITVSKPAEPVVISKPPRILNDVEIQAIQVQKLQVVYTVQQIPDVVRDSFVNFVDWGVEGTLSKLETRPRLQSVKRPLASLEMANPDERMNEDVIEPGIPNRRLVLCAFSETSALVLYQQGGYVGTERLVIFSFGKSSGAWAATLVDYKTGSLEAILDALRRHRYSLSIPKPPVQNPV